EQIALLAVVCAERVRELALREQRVTVGKPHTVRLEIVLGEVLAADAVVVGLDLPVLLSPEHSSDLLLAGELVEGVVVSGMPADRGAVALEELDLLVDGEHLLDERAAEVQQPHGEGTLVFGTERAARFLEELSDERAKLDDRGGLASAGNASLEEHARG